MPELIDIGANLTHDSFDSDREHVVQQAKDAGVSRFIVTGASREGSEAALLLAQRHPSVMYATAGVHPHHASDYDSDVENALDQLASHPEVVAIGGMRPGLFPQFLTR